VLAFRFGFGFRFRFRLNRRVVTYLFVIGVIGVLVQGLVGFVDSISRRLIGL